MKIRNLQICQYRGLKCFQMNGLGKVNLLVGTNNCGKTSVLEAVNLIMAGGDASTLWATLFRRGEDMFAEHNSNLGTTRQGDIRRLFHGHDLSPRAGFTIGADTDVGQMLLNAQIVEPQDGQQARLNLDQGLIDPAELTSEALFPRALALSWVPSAPKPLEIPITPQGGIAPESFRRLSRSSSPSNFPLRFISTSGFSADFVTSLFENIVLTPEEELVTEAMRIIEPSIERIASAGSDRLRPAGRNTTRGGILVRCKGVRDRIPIGSMGDGIWRMLALALVLVQSEDGILLIDEIDTGLHHTVMERLWRLVFEAAENYNIQIFATTHSRDCSQALAAICRDDVSVNSKVTIQRIERDRDRAIAYSEQEIVAAAERGIEVR